MGWLAESVTASDIKQTQEAQTAETAIGQRETAMSVNDTGDRRQAIARNTKSDAHQVMLKAAATPFMPHDAPTMKPTIVMGADMHAHSTCVLALPSEVHSQPGATLTVPKNAAGAKYRKTGAAASQPDPSMMVTASSAMTKSRATIGMPTKASISIA